MCLSRLVRIEDVAADGARAIGSAAGRRTAVSLAVLALEGDLPVPGDWVLVNTGLAVRRVSDEEAVAIAQGRAALREEI